MLNYFRFIPLLLVLSFSAGAQEIIKEKDYDFPEVDYLDSTLAVMSLSIPGGTKYTNVSFAPSPETQPEDLVTFRFFDAQGESCDDKDRLVFLLTGVGGEHNENGASYYAAKLAKDCYNVAVIPSIFNSDVLKLISKRGFLSDFSQDSLGFYQLLGSIKDYIEADMEKPMFSYSVLGYSLGGYTAAEIAKLDETEAVFNFNKVILVNTPVRLFQSMKVLDKYKKEYLGLGYVRKKYIYARMGKNTYVYRRYITTPITFKNFVNDLYFLRTSEKKALLGMSLSSSLFDIMHSSLDLCSAIYGEEFTYTIYNTTSYRDYIDEFIPYLYQEALGQTITAQELTKINSLERIESFLAGNKDIYVMHNADDFIVNEKDLEFLANTFKERFTLYPRGGHVGNLWYPKNMEKVLSILARN